MAAPPPPPADNVAIVEEFNRRIRLLARSLAEQYPSDATIARAQKRIGLAADVEPLAVLNTVGPYLYRYREQILAGDEAFFIENTYDAELREGVAADRVSLAAYIIPKVKEAWAGKAAAVKAGYKDTVVALLDLYLDFLAHAFDRR